jgi:hypothetical protein
VLLSKEFYSGDQSEQDAADESKGKAIKEQRSFNLTSINNC